MASHSSYPWVWCLNWNCVQQRTVHVRFNTMLASNGNISISNQPQSQPMANIWPDWDSNNTRQRATKINCFSFASRFVFNSIFLVLLRFLFALRNRQSSTRTMRVIYRRCVVLGPVNRLWFIHYRTGCRIFLCQFGMHLGMPGLQYTHRLKRLNDRTGIHMGMVKWPFHCHGNEPKQLFKVNQMKLQRLLKMAGEFDDSKSIRCGLLPIERKIPGICGWFFVNFHFIPVEM